MIIMMALNVLREAKDTAGRVRVLYVSQPRVKQAAIFLYLETICISCVENHFSVPQIAELISISHHAYLEVAMSSSRRNQNLY